MNLTERLEQYSTDQLLQLLTHLDKAKQSNQKNSGVVSESVSRPVLIAYYVKQGMAAFVDDEPCQIVAGVDEHELLEHCQKHLPAQHCPARYVALNKFPTLSNGKLAVKSLPLPGRQERAESHAANSDSQQALNLIAILSDLLGMDGIRSSDNFFEIGGDSITAMQFISRARQAGMEIDVATVSQSNTIADIAKVCSASVSTTSTHISTVSNEHENVQSEPAAKFAASGLSEDELDDFLQSFD